MSTLRLIVDTVYLQVYTGIKADPAVSWEREVTAALYMACPILFSLEFVISRLSNVFGIESLAQLAPNRVLYVLFFGVPIWFVVYQVTRRANKANRPVDRIAAVNDKIGKVWQRLFLVGYFVIPFVGLFWPRAN
jgi:hypothetical protein